MSRFSRTTRERNARMLVLVASLTVGLTAGTAASAAAAPAAVPAAAGQHEHTNPAATTTTVPTTVVVKVASGHSISEVVAKYPVTVLNTLLMSRGIYLLQATNPADTASMAAIRGLATRIAKSPAVGYAEPNYQTSLHSSRYVSWPEGQPTVTSGGSAAWLNQAANASLQLPTAHVYSQGLGIKVAVLDTGVDPTAPALQGRLQGGYDYIDDDATPTDVRENIDSNGNGTVDDAYGHGTFVAGLIALVAPDAMIMPYRVLDSDGVGNVYLVAQAIQDAAAAGARVINLSFGTDAPIESKTLADTVAAVQAAGVVVVAAAGNSSSTAPAYPAADSGVLSVSSLSGSTLSPWANRGPWVKVAAPGDSVVGPIPGGQYAIWSGTSMATPFVTGQVALLRAMNRTASAATVEAAVTSTSNPLTGIANGTINVLGSLAAVAG